MSTESHWFGRFRTRLNKWWRASKTRRRAVIATAGGALALTVTLSTIYVNVTTGNKNIADTAPTPTASGQSSSELAEKYDDTNPEGQGCIPDLERAPVVDLTPILAVDGGAAIATVELHKSLVCETKWIRVENSIEGAYVVKTIERKTTPELAGASTSTTDQTLNLSGNPLNRFSFGHQLYSGGCVTFGVIIKDETGTVLGELPPKEVC